MPTTVLARAALLIPPAPCPSHAISAASVSGVLIEGLRIESSGGDGIDLSTGVRDITIRSVVSSDNYRQVSPPLPSSVTLL